MKSKRKIGSGTAVAGVILGLAVVAGRHLAEVGEPHRPVPPGAESAFTEVVAVARVTDPDFTATDSTATDFTATDSTAADFTATDNDRGGDWEGGMTVLHTPWTETLESAVVPQRLEELNVVDARPVRVERVDGPLIGDRMALYIPHLERRFEAEVEHVEEHGNGDVSWRGHLRDEDGPYSVIATQGGRYYFATVATPEGSYQIESVGSDGWVYSVASLDSLMASGVEDFKIRR